MLVLLIPDSVPGFRVLKGDTGWKAVNVQERVALLQQVIGAGAETGQIRVRDFGWDQVIGHLYFFNAEVRFEPFTETRRLGGPPEQYDGIQVLAECPGGIAQSQ